MTTHSWSILSQQKPPSSHFCRVAAWVGLLLLGCASKAPLSVSQTQVSAVSPVASDHNLGLIAELRRQTMTSDAADILPQVVDVWPEGVPNPLPGVAPEHEEGGRTYNVSVPTLSVYRAAPAIATGTAAIVCPGGAYARLAVAKEGTSLTRWLNRLGVTVFLLKYRTAPFHHPAQLQDVLQSIRWVRTNAEKWGVDPRRLGVFGASAGGHLAAMAGTLFDSSEGKAGTALDQVSARPDFLVLMYPVITMRAPFAHVGSRLSLLGDDPSAALIDAVSLELHVTRNSPPTFIVHAQEDQSVPIDNSIFFGQALRRSGVPVEMHLYELGPHGFGLQPGLGPTSEWPHRCEEWMQLHGWLPKR